MAALRLRFVICDCGCDRDCDCGFRYDFHDIVIDMLVQYAQLCYMIDHTNCDANYNAGFNSPCGSICNSSCFSCFDDTASCCVSLVLFLVVWDDTTARPRSLVRVVNVGGTTSLPMHASLNIDHFFIPTNCILLASVSSNSNGPTRADSPARSMLFE
jgi:hypothetical protein